jgi:hypothetical protein
MQLYLAPRATPADEKTAKEQTAKNGQISAGESQMAKI